MANETWSETGGDRRSPVHGTPDQHLPLPGERERIAREQRDAARRSFGEERGERERLAGGTGYHADDARLQGRPEGVGSGPARTIYSDDGHPGYYGDGRFIPPQRTGRGDGHDEEEARRIRARQGGVGREEEPRRAAIDVERTDQRGVEAERERAFVGRRGYGEERESALVEVERVEGRGTRPEEWTHVDSRYVESVRHESTGALVKQFLGEAQNLAREEIQLAKAEMKEEAADAGKAAGAVGAGGAIAYAGLLALVAAVVVGLSAVLPLWLSALLVGLVVLMVGGIMAMGGLAKLKALKPVPEQTSETLKEDREWASRLKRDVQSRRHANA